ncbi:MAG: response regulator, partial [Deltaproteobacteria bacterium]|nr:response regulator [Deltaproteobacteria bacterium]
AALEQVAGFQPDLILLDIMMPGMDGFEVIKRLKADQAAQDIPVLFCTAMTGVEDEKKGLELGAIDYIRKPFSPPVVQARVRNHLELKLAQESLKEQYAILQENVRLRDEVERISRHDLKTPLNAVISVPNLLIEEGGLSPNQVEMLQMLEESGYRMLEIINSSLDLYKMETGAYQMNPVPVDILKLIRQIHGETREMIRSKQLTLAILVRKQEAGPDDKFLVAGEEMLCYS